MSEPVVRIRDLTIALPKGADRPHAVEGLNLDLEAGKILCVVGESGSGKSMSAYALTRLLPRALKPTAGSIQFEGRDLLPLAAPAWRSWRGRRIAMVFQEPMTALNPVMRIGDQIAEMFEAHNLLTRSARWARAVALATEVGLPNPEEAVRAYPHQLSGGQRQRAMIAMALALEPSVLVADEPTTALDVTTQAQILRLIRDLQQKRGMSVLFITHDFGVVAEIADHVAVLQRGRLVESGTAETVLRAPQAPYTKALLSSVPKPDPTVERERIVLQGDVPSPIAPPSGCSFHPRCPLAVEGLCDTEEPEVVDSNGHQFACHVVEEDLNASPQAPA